MSVSQILCLCGEPLRPNGNFCSRCGRELRQLCPICFDEPRRLVAKRDPYASPWCDNRGDLLLACGRCGRWFAADIKQCPDPDCCGSVGPTWPASTGRVADGTGYAGSWQWPAIWDRQNPKYTEPRHDTWHSNAPVYAAFVAHGRLYAWTETSLIAPEGAAGGPLAEAHSQGLKTPWSCWLKLDGQPNPILPVSHRVSLVGGGAILAAKNDFLLAGLYPYRSAEVVPLNLGTPLAQVASAGWWVGWSRQSSRPTLWLASISADWSNLNCQQIPDVPPQSAPRDNTPLVLRDGMAHWIGEDGDVWQLDCRYRDLQRLTDGLDGVQSLWRANDGLHTVRVTGNGLLVGLEATGSTGPVRESSGGTGPLRDLLASPRLLAIVGETITTLNVQTGDIMGGGKYSGQWIAGALADARPDAADQEPRLLMLTYDMGEGNLTALHPLSGGEEAVWRETASRPLSLIVAGESLYVVHERGVTRIQETLP